MINIFRPQTFPQTTEHILRIHEDYFPISFSQNCEVSNGLQSDDHSFNKHQANHQMPQYTNPITFRQGYDADASRGFGIQFNFPKCCDPWEEHKIKVPAQYLYDDANQNVNKNVLIEHEIHHRISQGHGNSASGYHQNGFGTDSEQHPLNSQTREHVPNAAANQHLPNSGIKSGLARHICRRRMHGFADQPQVCSYQSRDINIPSQESERKTAFVSAKYSIFGNEAEQGFGSSTYDLDFNSAFAQPGLHRRQQSAITQDAFHDSSLSTSLKDFPQSADLRPKATLASLQHDDIPIDSNPIFLPLKVIQDPQSTEFIQQINQSLPLQAIAPVSANLELLMQDWHEALISLPPHANSSLSKSRQKFQQHVELADTHKAIDKIDVASKSAATPVHIWMNEGDVNPGIIAGTEVDRKHVTGSGRFLQRRNAPSTGSANSPAKILLTEVPSMDAKSWGFNNSDDNSL